MYHLVEKYLYQYGETECRQLTGFPTGFSQALVIPVYQEDDSVLKRFTQFCVANPKTLLILVINRPDNDTDYRWSSAFFSNDNFSNNTVYWQSADATLKLLAIGSPASHSSTLSRIPGSALLLVDRCSNGRALPKDQGVGLARKIGADIVCMLTHQKKVQSRWIFNTDADALLPADYFSAVNNTDSDTAALIYPFEHCFTNNIIAPLPTLLYEFSLHYYVDGLSRAGSPYAYHTLGSTIAVNFLHYAKVRGFPKRAGAEDFYLLNKLAKTGKIISLAQPLIQLIARESTRVPFGTGPAVMNLAAKSDQLSMPLYHPQSFDYLQVFLQLLNTLSEQRAESFTKSILNVIEEQQKSGLDVQILLNAAEHFTLAQALEHSFRHGKKKSTRLQHLHHWFDGFKTLKFIHYLRDNVLGSITFQQWLTNNRRIDENRLTATLQRMHLNDLL